METESLIRVWLASCWLAAIGFVVIWTVWGINMTVTITNRQVLQAASTVRTAIQKAERAEHKIDLFIMSIDAKSDDKPIEIDSNVLAEMRNMWMLIERESKKLGISPQEFMLRVSELLGEKK